MVTKKEVEAAVMAALARDTAEAIRVWAEIEKRLWPDTAKPTKGRQVDLSHIMAEIDDNAKGVIDK